MRRTILKSDSEKRVLVRRLSDQKCSLMFFYDESPENTLPHEKVSDNITIIHPPYEYDVLEKWLYLGNWHAIFPSNAKYEPFNTFKTKDFEIEQRLEESKIKLLIDSFHDDIEWNVIEAT
jgi:hypothetical protein